MRTYNKFQLYLLALVAMVFIPGWTTAQVWVEPHIGWNAPTSDLGRTDIISSNGFGEFERAEPHAVFGLGVGLNLGNQWSLRASVDRALEAAVEGEWKCAPFVACPAVLLPLDGQLSYWNVALDALYRIPLPVPVSPYLSAGIGLRKSDLDWSDPPADIVLPAFSFNETNVAYRLGVGVEYLTGVAAFFGAVEASASRFGGAPFRSIEGSIEEDRPLALEMGITAGVRFPFGL